MTDKYYRWLLPALVENSFDKDFWEKQKSGLAELGLDFNPALLAKAFVTRGYDLVTTPTVTVKNIMEMARRRGKLQARYY